MQLGNELSCLLLHKRDKYRLYKLYQTSRKSGSPKNADKVCVLGTAAIKTFYTQSWILQYEFEEFPIKR